MHTKKNIDKTVIRCKIMKIFACGALKQTYDSKFVQKLSRVRKKQGPIPAIPWYFLKSDPIPGYHIPGYFRSREETMV